jgi:hypothetical protein
MPTVTGSPSDRGRLAPEQGALVMKALPPATCCAKPRTIHVKHAALLILPSMRIEHAQRMR